MNHKWAIPTLFQPSINLFELPKTCNHRHHLTTNNKKLLCSPCTTHAQRNVFTSLIPNLSFLSFALLLTGCLVEATITEPLPTTTSTSLLHYLIQIFKYSSYSLLLLIAILITNTFFTKSPGLSLETKNKLSHDFKTKPSYLELSQNQTNIAQRLGEAIQFQTVSYDKTDLKNEIDYAEFLKLHAWLQTTYPLVHKHLTRTVINKYSLLYKWTGANDAQAGHTPYMVYGHMDVVPVVNQWQHVQNPFSGEIKPDPITGEEQIWGRGAIDLKNMCIGWMEALENLLEHGFRPKRTLYLGLGHDEEIGGKEGAAHIAQHLADNNVRLDFLWDEGLFVINGVVKGHDGKQEKQNW